MHMTSSSAMMIGSKLHLQYLTTNHTGLNSQYRWTGKMMGIKMDFTVAYQMRLFITPEGGETNAELSITYKALKTFLQNLYPSFLQTSNVTGV